MGGMRTEQVILGLALLCLSMVSAQKAPTITCGKYTHRIIEVGKKTWSVFQTQKETRRCTLIYKVTGGCQKANLRCGAFFLPNKDPYTCEKGDRMYVKAAGTKPRPYCEHKKPTKNFPAVAEKLKIIVTLNPDKGYPNKGVKCSVTCDD